MHFIDTGFWLIFLIHGVFTSEIKIEQVPSPRSLCGEGPHWDEATQSLYYIDVFGPDTTMLRYDFNENKTYAAKVDNEPLMTFILPVKGKKDQFLVGTKHAVQIICWDGKSPKGYVLDTLFQVETKRAYAKNRWNDAKCDPTGRFFGGTMRVEECDPPFNVVNGSLYRYGQDNGLRELKKNVFISNGLAWNIKTSKFYYIDSCTHDIKQFDYDIDTGDISNEKTVFVLKENGKTPDYILDGMTIDTKGFLYAACMFGNKVLKVNPGTGQIVAEYKFPHVNQISSVTFGGPKMDILFVTTASKNGDKAPEAGHLYKITGLKASGLPSVKANI